MTEPLDETDWLSPTDALALLEPLHGPGTASYIAFKLKEGLVRAQASEMWESQDRSLNSAWQNRDEAEIEKDVEVDPAVWQSSRHWKFDQDAWRWTKNRFVVTRRKKPADRTILHGLKFARADIEKLLHNVSPSLPSKGSGGRTKQLDRWTAFWHVVVELAREDKIQPARFDSQEEFRAEILCKLGTNGLSDSAIRPTVRQIWKKFMDPAL